jgi:hypothetical protein
MPERLLISFQVFYYLNNNLQFDQSICGSCGTMLEERAVSTEIAGSIPMFYFFNFFKTKVFALISGRMKKN